jgi:hypothetical protein
MSARTTVELLAAIRREQSLQAAITPDCAEWRISSQHLVKLFEELRHRTSAAVGGAFAATLLGVPQRDLEVPPALGKRLLMELRKRGLAVFPTGDLPPA